MRPTLLLLALGISALAAAQDPVDDAPRPGVGLAFRFGAWFPTRSGSDTGFSYGVGYLLPSNRDLKLEPEFFGSFSRHTANGVRENTTIYKLGLNALLMPSNARVYYGAGAGIAGGSGTGSDNAQLVFNVIGGYKLDKSLFAEARFNVGTRDFLNGFGINLGYRF